MIGSASGDGDPEAARPHGDAALVAVAAGADACPAPEPPQVFPIVRHATVDDLPIVEAILDDVRSWLAASAIHQWTRPFDAAWLLPRIAAGQVWIAGFNGEAVAIVRLLWADPAVWGERDGGDAAYVHTLAVRRDRAGEGIGRRVLEWAATHARAAGKRGLRLDCVADNPGLLAYYDLAGFARVGTARAGGDDLILFERALPGPPGRRRATEL